MSGYLRELAAAGVKVRVDTGFRFQHQQPMDQPSESDQRKYFRLKYPVAERPIVRSEDSEYEIAEISEGGARVIVAGQGSFDAGQPFSGTILFADGEEVDIRGIVLRCEGDEVAVRLSIGISFKRMVSEQAQLKQRLTWVFDSDVQKNSS